MVVWLGLSHSAALAFNQEASLADLPRRLTVLFSFLALLGWAFWGLRRKYGVQKS
jgi:hypothetical protein